MRARPRRVARAAVLGPTPRPERARAQTARVATTKRPRRLSRARPARPGRSPCRARPDAPTAQWEPILRSQGPLAVLRAALERTLRRQGPELAWRAPLGPTSQAQLPFGDLPGYDRCGLVNALRGLRGGPLRFVGRIGLLLVRRGVVLGGRGGPLFELRRGHLPAHPAHLGVGVMRELRRGLLCECFGAVSVHGVSCGDVRGSFCPDRCMLQLFSRPIFSSGVECLP